jgi:hypothetical protein
MMYRVFATGAEMFGSVKFAPLPPKVYAILANNAE